MLPQVFGPRLDNERFNMLLGVLEVREHAPLDRPVPASNLAERMYRGGETRRVLRFDPVIHCDHYRSVIRMGLKHTLRRGPVHRGSEVHFAVGGEAVAEGCGEARDQDRKSTRLNSSHIPLSRMPSSA